MSDIQKFQETPVRTILVSTAGELLGDGMMKLPFLRAIRKTFPHASVSWLTVRDKTSLNSILTPLAAPQIDTFIEQIPLGYHWKYWVNHPLKNSSYDLIFSSTKRLATSLLLKRISHRRFISSEYGWLLSDLKPESKAHKTSHVADKMLELVHVAGGMDLDRYHDIQIPLSFKEHAQFLIGERKNIVLLAPGAGSKHKCWPLSYFIELSRLLLQEQITPMIILGPEEEDWYHPLSEAIPSALFPLQQTTEKSIFLTLALGELAGISIGNDSGATHLLAAANKPMITLFGPSSSKKFTPLNRDVKVITAQEFGGDSMNLIPVKTVYDAILFSLNQSWESKRTFNTNRCA
jgi:ADP-heptose:LPS heptosyltransferase